MATLAPEGETASEVDKTRLYTVTAEGVGEEESAPLPSRLRPSPLSYLVLIAVTTGYQVIKGTFNLMTR